MRHILLLLTLTLLTKSLTAQDSTNNSILWKISGKDMKVPSYLFGTVHMICQDKYIWTNPMKEAFESTEELCMEMDLDDSTLLMQVAMGMALPFGQKMSDFFSESDFTVLKQYYRDSLKIDISALMGLKPIVLQTLFVGSAIFCDSIVSYEVILTEKAKNLGKEVTGLESAQEQIQLLDKIPNDTITAEIMRTIRGEDEQGDDLIALMDAYHNQDIETVHSFITKENIPGGELSMFIDERNEKWIERMEERMEQNPVFFAVGAGHLWGENGVINLLKVAGYTVEPVK